MHVTLALVLNVALGSAFGELSEDQRLIVACYELCLDDVVRCLREGANVNATFGDHDEMTGPFQDRWDASFHIGSSAWTPLLALAAASNYPYPPADFDAHASDWKQVEVLQKEIPRQLLRNRQITAAEILHVLLSHGCDLERDDGYGATALYLAVEYEKVQMVKVLLRYGANPNTKTRAYIDGSSDITPLHNACRSMEMMQLLLDHGANPLAKDSEGETAADWVKLHGNGDFDLVVTGNGAVIRPRTKGGVM